MFTPAEPPPSRHRGARTVIRKPNLVRAVTVIRDNISAQAARIRPEIMTFTSADPALGYPADAAAMANVATTRVYRSGRALYADIAVGTGDASVVAAQLAVPDLGATGPAVTSDEGGTFQDLRLQMEIPDTWEMGIDYRVYVQAMRVSGADATTLRVLRAWQR